MATYEHALAIATEAHHGQIDQAGADYILHQVLASDAVDGIAATIVALLHNVVEDCPAWSLERLREAGFGDESTGRHRRRDAPRGRALRSLRPAGRNHPIGRIVKISDLRDNMDLSRLPRITAKDEDRNARYARALGMIVASAGFAQPS